MSSHRLDASRSSGAFRGSALGLFILLLLLSTGLGCTSDAATNNGSVPPDPQTLFGDHLPAPTPAKLRGVWQNIQPQTNATIELRIGFVDRYLVGAAKCSAVNDGPMVIAGGSVGLDTAALDAATGKVTFGTLELLKEENGLHCELALPGNTYNFTIADGKLSFTTGDAKLNPIFTKIAD